MRYSRRAPAVKTCTAGENEEELRWSCDIDESFNSGHSDSSIIDTLRLETTLILSEDQGSPRTIAAYQTDQSKANNQYHNVQTALTALRLTFCQILPPQLAPVIVIQQ